MFDENSVVTRILSGDDAAFERLIDRYEHRVYQYALRFLGRQTDACIAAEEIFSQIYTKIETYAGTKLSIWVFRIAANVCAEYQHHRRGSKNSVFSEMFHPRTNEPQENKDISDGVQIALLRLTRQQREVLLLRDLCGLNDEETGQVLGLDENGVRQRLSRARKNLREQLLRHGVLEQQAEETHKKDCVNYRELCSRYVDECISDADKTALLDHIQECPACAAYLADLTLIGRSLAHMEQETPPQELREKIITAACRQAEQVQKRRRRAAYWPMIALIGCTCIILVLLSSGVLGGWFVNSGNGAARPKPHPDGEVVETPITAGLEADIVIPEVVLANSYAFVIAAEGNTDLPELSTAATLLSGDAGNGVEYYLVNNDLNLVQKLTDGMESVGYEIETVNNNQLVISSGASQGLFIVIHKDA